MEQKNVVFRHTLIYGLIIGIVMDFYQFVLYFFGMNNNATLTSLVAFIYVVGLLIAVKYYRDDVQDGVINFKRAFSVGMLTTVYVALIGAIYSYILYKYLSPGLVGEQVKMYKDSFSQSSFPKDQVNAWINLLSQIISPAFLAYSYILRMILIGSILSLLMAFLLRKDIGPSSN